MFSIIVCTYNPNPYIFQRLLNAVNDFNKASPTHEVIIVDNNSTVSLLKNSAVGSFLLSKNNSRLILESIPGLTSARVAGIKHAKYDWIIFFDDDNEPAVNYLIKASEAIQQHTQVGAWGPGTVEVEYINRSNKWLDQQRPLFQQRNTDKVQYAQQHHWQICYPFGTGLIVKKNIATEYTKRIENGRYTLSDRKGNSLSSGGDVQIVLTGIDMGYSAGVSPGIVITHLIHRSKVRFSYMLKLVYGTESVYIKAYNEVFTTNQIQLSRVNNFIVIMQIWFYIKKYLKEKNYKSVMLAFANKLGQINAAYVCNEKLRKPLILIFIEKTII